MSILLRACAVLVLALVGLPERTAVPATSTLHRSDTRVLRLASLSLAHHSRAAVIRWLQRQPAIASARVGLDGQTVDLRFRDGGQAAILPRTMQTVPIAPQLFRSHLRTLSPSHAPGDRAIVLEPFAFEQLGPSAGVAQIRDLQAAGFQVDKLYDGAVTVASMATLSNYRIVYIHTHGGVNSYGEAVIESGQEVNDNDHSLDPLIKNFSVMTTGIVGSDKVYYGIMSRYILFYMHQFPANSMVFVNTCSLLKASLFWKALQIRGVSTLVSYDEEPILPDALAAGDRFFDTMAQGRSVSETVALAQAQHWDTSTSDGHEAHLGYVGDGLVTFDGRSSAPLAATPYPMPTPYIVPTPGGVPPPPPFPTATPTSTPSPTSTPTPLPPPKLVVSLRQKVSPGSKQVITVHSAPSIPLHLQVTYPNGDIRSGDRTTDAKGTARYTYVQPSSKIQLDHYKAQVLVTAGSGPEATSVMKTYRIGFGKVDVSVAPWFDASAKIISIWVHAGAHTRVSLSFVAANTRLGQRTTVTNAQGWSLVNYHPSAISALPSHLAIVIHASVESGGTTYSTRTTFLTP